MRILITLLFLSISITGYATPVFEKLSSINKCWLEQKDIDCSALPADMKDNDQDWIRLHLTYVERTLRSRSTDGLTKTQKQNRLRALDHLHAYMLAGAFPQNEDYTYRTPIFIDKHDNFCAVGYLVKATGYEQVSRTIAAKTNLAYVREMNYPELFAWAKDYGFTVDELAWIQPTYGPAAQTLVVAQGTDGPVQELYVGTGDKLYVGGNFANVGASIAAGSIGYVTEAANVFSWHTMGSGVNGTVLAIAEYNNDIFVGGAFTNAGGIGADNIAYWDGAAWHSAGCLNGTVKDLIVYNNTLYACGSFTICPATNTENFAYWTGNAWQAVSGLSGTVNTMEANGGQLYLGGNFTWNSNPTNIIQWNNSVGFQSLGGSVDNEVKDIIVYQNTVYASCKQTLSNSGLLQKLQANAWTQAVPTSSYVASNTLSFNTFCDYNDTLVVGGDFYYVATSVGTSVYHNRSLSLFALVDNFYVDAPINKMVNFKNHLVSGGDFTGHIIRKVVENQSCNPPSVSLHNKTDTSIDAIWYAGPSFSYEYALNTSITPPASGTVTNNFSHHFSNLAPFSTYYMHVRRSCLSAPYITPWQTIAFTTLPPPPPPCTPPGTITVTNVTDQNADINWTPSNMLVTYQYAVNTSMIPPLTAPVTQFSSYKATSLQADSKYYVHLRTICGTADTSEWTRTDFTTAKTSISNLNSGDGIVSIYPNPVKDKLVVTVNRKDEKGELSLSDMTGKELIRTNVNRNNIQLDLSHLAAGMYLLQYTSASGSQTIKLTRQ